MELIYLISLLLLLLPISLLLILVSFSNHNKELPPGNTGWPIIGETMEFLSLGRKGTPELFCSERTARYSSEIFRTSLFGERVTVLCGAEANKFLLSTESRRVEVWWPASMGKIFPTIFGGKDGYNEHSLRSRRMIVGFLKPESLKKYVAVMDPIAMQLVRNISTTTSLTVYPLAKRYTFNIACKAFFSIEDPHHIAKIFEPFSVLLAGLVAVPINLPGLPLNRAIKASQVIRNEILSIIKQRKIELASPTSAATTEKNDMLSVMLTATDEAGHVREDIDIADTIVAILFAGYGTTSMACTSIINYMADLPTVYEKVYKEQMEIARSKQVGEMLTWEDLEKMSYSWNVANEAMRLMPPAQFGFRQALVDLKYAGFSIPKHTTIFWSPNSTHKDPKYFPEPDKFDPTRFQGNKVVPYSYMAFGGGARMCPGNEYARLKILVFMHNMVKTFKWEKMIPDERIIVDPMPRFEKGLLIRLYPH